LERAEVFSITSELDMTGGGGGVFTIKTMIENK
jgi:hypothetical protein